MIRNEDTVEDFLPIEQYSIQNVSNNSNELTIIHQRDEQHSESTPNSTVRVHEIGFYGWRKKCLYFFLLLATVAIVINAALTLWIIAVLSFSMVFFHFDIYSYSNSYSSINLNSVLL